MKYMKLGKSEWEVPVIAIGGMRMTSLQPQELDTYVKTALEMGANFYDHADIYGYGECEAVFGQVLKENPGLREQLTIQTKCGIIPGKMYDFSKEHILDSVDASLKRLHADYLDGLILHRPDALMEPEEVAEAFDILEKEGKVRYFGVSNQNSMQIQLLSEYVHQNLQVNQLQLSIPQSSMISSGLEVNRMTEGGADHTGYVLDYCRLRHITVQAWSPFQYGDIEGSFIGNEKFSILNQTLRELAETYNSTVNGIAAAWILRHPAKIQLIAGTMNLSHLKDICDAADIMLSREDWYRLYLDAGHVLP